jgi:hypothetical protein
LVDAVWSFCCSLSGQLQGSIVGDYAAFISQGRRLMLKATERSGAALGFEDLADGR